MGAVSQEPLLMVAVEAGAVTVTVWVVMSVVVVVSQRLAARVGVATARMERARAEMAERRENMVVGCEDEILAEESLQT